MSNEKQMTETQQALQRMFTENTGAHMLDSGGAYGRHHERNRKLAGAGVTYLDLPAATVDFSNGWIDYTRQVCHWIEESCDYRPDLQADFTAFTEDSKDSWFQDLEAWLEDRGFEVKGTDNTYNGENCISQVVQYTAFEDGEGTSCVAIMLHQGCDVRGGYTRPYFFECENEYLDASSGTIFCSGDSDHAWYTDDTCHWYYQSGFGQGMVNLEDYERSDDPNDKGKGKLYVDDDGNGYCPHCGGLLQAAH